MSSIMRCVRPSILGVVIVLKDASLDYGQSSIVPVPQL
jgi:hypothetical protein